MKKGMGELKIIFFGSPQIAVPFLQELFKKEVVVGVVTRPDKASGRGHHIHQTPVAQESFGKVELQKPAKLKDEFFFSWLKTLKADLGVVVAYGKILPEEILSIPTHGFINIHFSLLPKYRGAAPIQHAILNNESETGVTSFLLKKELDAGPVYIQKKVPVLQDDDCITLTKKLIDEGKKVLRETLELLKKGLLKGTSQEGHASYAPLIKKEDGKINWEKTPAENIKNQVRALLWWPCAHTHFSDNKILKITVAEIYTFLDKDKLNTLHSTQLGEIVDLVKDKGFIVKCTDTYLLITRVIPEGKKEMSAWDFVNGRFVKIGDRLL